MTVIYVTKYALSSGVFKVDAELMDNGSYALWWKNSYMNSAHGKDFWLAMDEALKDCERRRNAKLNSIEKQKSKLQNMVFNISEG